MPRRTQRYRGNSSRTTGLLPWRGAILSVLAAWNRYQVARIIGAVAAAWVLGATALFFAERGDNPDFASWEEALWSAWVLLFSGLHEPPSTTVGRLITISVECHNPKNRNHLRKAGADEIISSDELGLRLLARSALFHGMTRVYQELLRSVAMRTRCTCCPRLRAWWAKTSSN
jgi:voltage-gated potassium channel Kch